MIGVNTRANPGYRAELGEYLIFYSRVTCVISIVLLLLGVGLDMVFYPAHVEEFLIVRVLGASMIGAVLVSYRYSWGIRNLRSLTYFWLSIPQLAICWMIFRTEGEISIYFVGLTFALSGIGFFLPLSLFEALSFGGITLFVYVLACALRSEGVQSINVLMGNSTFILFYTLICAMIAIYSDRWRWHAFQLKTEIQERNTDLRKVNQALAEIKGHMVQQEKMAALGTLSAGLLHEVNNPVNYSLMALNMALIDPAVEASPELKESLVDSREGMKRVQSIVSDLKTFAYQKPGEDSERIFLFEKAIQSALRLTGYELKGIDVQLDLPLDTHVHGDEPGLIGVLINLFSNAALALQKSGRSNPTIAIRVWPEGDRLYVTVRDNGTGIKPENLTRVFEPFFTTRDVGQGLGLGLSVSYAITQRHGGALSVTSEHGEWTEFAFNLALANPHA